MGVLPEIREVKDPPSPAVAYTENGRTVVEVDEKLTGRERSAAIFAAWWAHERRVTVVLPVAGLVYLWDPFVRWAARSPGQATAAAAAGGGALVMAAGALALVLAGNGEQPPTVRPSASYDASPSTLPRTLITASPTPVSPTPTVSTPDGTPTRERSARQPTSMSTRTNPNRRPEPTRSTPRGPARTARPQRTPEPPPPSEPRKESSESAAGGSTEPPAPVRPTPKAVTPTPQTPPSRNCLVDVDLNPLLDLCLRP